MYNEEKKRPTVGAIARELSQKEVPSHDTRDYYGHHAKRMGEELDRAIKLNREECKQNDFYIVVLTKREQLKGLRDTYRFYYTARYSCPTPNYDQTVFKYHYHSDTLEYLWSVPNIYACEYLMRNKNLVEGRERESLKEVLQFYDHTLLKTAMLLNGELDDQIKKVH